LTFIFGGNRLLFKSRMPKAAIPEAYLVVISSDIHGAISFSSRHWTSVVKGVIAASELREQQEAMLLMRAGDWVETCCGFWCLSPAADAPFGMRLELSGDRPGA
jgi:hypothetical protein